MRAIMVIGGMGSGKSSVCKMLAARGACVIDLDSLGHEVLEQPQVIDSLAAAFGDGVIADGRVDRAALAKVAFASPQASAVLCGITHPAIVRLALARLAKLRDEGCSQAVLEVSAFNGFDGPFAALADVCFGIVVVRAPLELRVQRACEGRFSEEDVRMRISRQPGDDERAAWADCQIVNDGTLDDLEKSVARVWQRYFT